MTAPQAKTAESLSQTPARAAEIVREYGPFAGADQIHGVTHDRFLDEKDFWVIFEAAEALDVPIYLHPSVPHSGAVDAYFKAHPDVAAKVVKASRQQ